jgi:purine-binding chemotaxis protein CheW
MMLTTETACLCFRVEDEWYLHDVSNVREIIPYDPPSPVPGEAPQNLGILDFRGEVIAVFSGRSLLHLPQMDDRSESKLIVFEGGQGSFAVSVDEVAEILAIDPAQVLPPPAGKQGQVIQGTYNHQGKLLILIDFSQSRDIPADT